MTLGVLAAFLLYLRRFFEPMQELSQFYNLFQAAAAGAREAVGRARRGAGGAGAGAPVPAAGSPGRDRASRACASPTGDDTVLHRLDLDIPAGQTVALVGATGAGKTTIARLIARFYDPTDGRRPARRRRPARAGRRRPAPRRRHGHPGELPVLRHRRRQHRASAGPTPHVPRSSVAAEAIGAHDFIAALPDGYDTDVQQQGRPAVGRAAPARRLRPRLPRRPRGADPRRGDVVARHPERAAGAAGAAHAARRPHRGDHRPPADDGGDRRPGARRSTAAASSRTAPPAELVDGGGRYAALHQAWLDSLA